MISQSQATGYLRAYLKKDSMDVESYEVTGFDANTSAAKLRLRITERNGCDQPAYFTINRRCSTQQHYCNLFLSRQSRVLIPSDIATNQPTV